MASAPLSPSPMQQELLDRLERRRRHVRAATALRHRAQQQDVLADIAMRPTTVCGAVALSKAPPGASLLLLGSIPASLKDALARHEIATAVRSETFGLLVQIQVGGFKGGDRKDIGPPDNSWYDYIDYGYTYDSWYLWDLLYPDNAEAHDESDGEVWGDGPFQNFAKGATLAFDASDVIAYLDRLTTDTFPQHSEHEHIEWDHHYGVDAPGTDLAPVCFTRLTLELPPAPRAGAVAAAGISPRPPAEKRTHAQMSATRS